MSMISVDVLVLGLGPAGACAAAQVARQGCSVIAVDRKQVAGHPVQCAEFVPAMIGMDVADLQLAVRQRIASMTTFVEQDAPDIKENFPGHMLDRAAFDAHLVGQALASGAQCTLGVSARRITAEGVVILSDGRSIMPHVIIGADGPRSLAGRAIGQINTALVETRQITVPLHHAHEATDIFLSADIPGGYGWLFPKGDVANLGAGVDPEFKHQLKPIVHRLHQTLMARDQVGARILGMTGGLIPVGGLLQPHGRIAHTQVLLAGDAAGLTNPVTGAGISAAVHSGRLAGLAAVATIGGDLSAPQVYAEELNDVFGAALTRARRRRVALAARQPGKEDLRQSWIAYPQYWTA
ncbi:MAG: NAD(P)/FAD-dependent oxidoreductase [Burkholderiales bacterium]|jgi:digeranylgeranylglycerophospholipid reductase|nr:NAD(P)/FAD-dependent oxidoreductase [Burkholderiales bacterium]